MKIKFKAYIYLFTAMFLAGSSVVVAKLVISTFPLFFSQVITLVIALAVITTIAFIFEGNIFKIKIKKKDVLYLWLQSLSGMFLFRIFLLYGLEFTTASQSGIITSTGPAALAVLSLIMLKEKISLRKWGGIVLCVLGIVLVNTISPGKEKSQLSHLILGNALVLLAVIGESLFTVFRKKISFDDKPITSTMIIIAFALAMFMPLGIAEGVKFDFNGITFTDFVPLIIYGIFCTVMAYICWFSGVSKVSITVAAGFTGVMPASSVLLSILVLSERITWQHIAGIALVIVGIYTIAFHNEKKKRGQVYN